MLYEELKISTCSMCHKLRTQTRNLNTFEKCTSKRNLITFEKIKN